MPKNLVIIHYLCWQYYKTIYKPNAMLLFYICCVFFYLSRVNDVYAEQQRRRRTAERSTIAGRWAGLLVRVAVVGEA